MKIQKAQWTTDGDRFNLGMPLTKINKEERIVSGWASLDNPDLQGDIVLAEASEEAFKRFRGNIREMHQPIAVGRMLNYRPDSYYDTVTKKFYNGIWVDVYISKGAESTWEKILDGTLQAFSIKGPIKDYEYQFSKDAGTQLRVVKAYEMEELSVVDSGGNQLANIMSFAKVNGETVLKGIDVLMKSESVFYCAEDGVAKTSNEDSVTCSNGHEMKNIGWIEYDSDNEKTEKVAEVIKAFSPDDTTKGGVNVAEENVETTEPEAGEEKATEVKEVPVVETETVTETTVKAEEVKEVEEVNIAKMIGDLQGAIQEELKKNLKASTDAIEKATGVFETKLSELDSKHGELVSKVESLKTELESVEKSLRAVESETVVKKSGDLGGSSEKVLEKRAEKSKWGGLFLGVDALDNE